MNSDYLFVYGTLLNDIENEMSQYLSSNSEYIDKGFVYGKLYKVSWYPGIVLSSTNSEKVYGKVYKIKNSQCLFNVLDDYEGIGVNNPQPYLFKRELVSVYLEGGDELRSWIYTYNLSVEGLKHYKSGHFLN